MNADQFPEMLDELVRATTPAQPRLDYETLRARYEWLCRNAHRLKMTMFRDTDGKTEIRSIEMMRPDEGWPSRDFELDPAQVDDLVAEAMKGQG